MEELLSVIRWKIDQPSITESAAGRCIHSPTFAAAGRSWRLNFFPKGQTAKNGAGKNLFASLFLEMLTPPAPPAPATEAVTATFEFAVVGTQGRKSSPALFCKTSPSWGWNDFAPPSIVDKCVVLLGRVFTEDMPANFSAPLPRPLRSGVTEDIAKLLESKEMADVDFSFGGESFAAHKLVLAARSPVFKAQFYGPLADAGSKAITIREMRPVVFEALLHYAYTDQMLSDDKLDLVTVVDEGESSVDNVSTLQEIYAAADCYGMESLKEKCEEKLSQRITADTVVPLLVSAVQYNCTRLKCLCLGFIVNNALDVMLSDGYMQLLPSHPDVSDELRKFKQQRKL